MTDILYHERRLVSWIARWCHRGESLEQILARNTRRRPPFAAEDVRRLYGTGCQAVRNTAVIGDAMRELRELRAGPQTPEALARIAELESIRMCDLDGCKFPKRRNVHVPIG